MLLYIFCSVDVQLSVFLTQFSNMDGYILPLDIAAENKQRLNSTIFCSARWTARTTGRLSTIWRLRAMAFLPGQRSPLETVG